MNVIARARSARSNLGLGLLRRYAPRNDMRG